MFNLGGPDGMASVKPFLRNLFNDPLILRMPGPLRWALARLIVARRAPVARDIYAMLGGGSPILAETIAQAKALETSLGSGKGTRVFVAMRYWHPFSEEAAREVKAFLPDQVVLLPLYPQFSSSTTASSFAAWMVAANAVGLLAPTTMICCYPDETGFVHASARLVREGFAGTSVDAVRPRVLFSAHGVPQKFIDRGDPYRHHVERTVAAIVAELGIKGLDHVVCYQSRVGRGTWLEPYTEDEIKRAGHDGAPVVVVPVAFVSEHLETLVELDVTYRQLAVSAGVPGYVRVPTVGIAQEFIEGLAGLVRRAAKSTEAVICGGSKRCAAGFRDCPLADRVKDAA